MIKGINTNIKSTIEEIPTLTVDPKRLYATDDVRNKNFEREHNKNKTIKPGIKVASLWVRFWSTFGFYKNKTVALPDGGKTPLVGKDSLVAFLNRHRDALKEYKRTDFFAADVSILKQAFIEYRNNRMQKGVVTKEMLHDTRVSVKRAYAKAEHRAVHVALKHTEHRGPHKKAPAAPDVDLQRARKALHHVKK